MRVKGGRRKAGMNRTMAYSRPGSLRAKTIKKMEERGGKVCPVDPRNTSLRCTNCFFACKESRDGEDYDCIMCGWYHHADKLGGCNVKLICLHKEAGGESTKAGLSLRTVMPSQGERARGGRSKMGSRDGPA